MKKLTKIIFIIGGAASGKSTYAQQLAIKSGKPVTLIATATASDPEMASKIAAHQKARPRSWLTLETQNEALFKMIKLAKTPVIIIDCLTMFVSTQMVISGKNKDQILVQTESIIKAIKNHKACKKFIIVSNEVGSGLVPDSKQSRDFREILGAVNKKFMAAAHQGILMVAGQPLHVK
jgi:adenosylcobinamide kinase/adenosylcobinamide-phosphate guanylyltransferase